MASFVYLYNRLCGHLRADIVIFERSLSKRTEDIELCHCRSGTLNSGKLCAGAFSDIVENLVFELDYSVLCSENFCLEVF